MIPTHRAGYAIPPSARHNAGPCPTTPHTRAAGLAAPLSPPPSSAALAAAAGAAGALPAPAPELAPDPGAAHAAGRSAAELQHCLRLHQNLHQIQQLLMQQERKRAIIGKESNSTGSISLIFLGPDWFLAGAYCSLVQACDTRKKNVECRPAYGLSISGLAHLQQAKRYSSRSAFGNGDDDKSHGPEGSKGAGKGLWVGQDGCEVYEENDVLAAILAQEDDQ
eukprot:1160346-Pelagomonas_calceolata.AAC.11